VPVYRLGGPDGRYWSPVDPRSDPDYYEHMGMRHEDNPGNVVTVGSVAATGMGTTWIPMPGTDYDGNSLGNGHIQIIIPNPRGTVRNPRTFDVDPRFWR